MTEREGTEKIKESKIQNLVRPWEPFDHPGGKVRKGVNLEIPIFGASYADQVLKIGAVRFELNAAGSYPVGGLTPTFDDLRALRKAIGNDDDKFDVPIRIMIRPRGILLPGHQDFIYSEEEYREMAHSIRLFKESGLLRVDRGDGFVFGVLKRRHGQQQPGDEGEGEENENDNEQANANANSQSAAAAMADVAVLGPNNVTHGGAEVDVDIERNSELVRIARPFKAVFHRAFDEVLGWGGLQGPEQTTEKERRAFEDVKTCGFDGILTSGGMGQADHNTERLKRILAMVREEAARPGGGGGRNIEIIVGGGVRSWNLGGLRVALERQKGSDSEGPELWFHSSCCASRGGEWVFDEKEAEALVEMLPGTFVDG